MSLFLHKSNRTERLCDALAEVVAHPLANVFEPEWIVVSSPGMERWLSNQLARRLSVWANPAFPFPRKVIDALLGSLVPAGALQVAAYEPACLTFGIARLLREHADDPAFAEPLRYCAGDNPQRKRLALAGKLAELFDQYLSYRPELMLRWQELGDDGFQPALFKELCRTHGALHLPERARQALDALARGVRPTGLPQRLHVFGISSLPPLYIDLFGAFAQHADVHIFRLEACREYYGDLRSKRERKRNPVQRQLSFDPAEFQPEPHALLAALGRTGREFQELLEERTQYREGVRDLFEEPGEDSLLHVLQSDLLALRSRDERTRHLLQPDDHSISIHACHGPMREVEVLHDRLVELIAEHGVEAHEIVVMASDIGEYAPRIDAVFSQPAQQRPPIPFRIADRSLRDSEPLFLALDAVCDLLQSRFGANQVLDLLGIELIRERFEIAPDQLDRLRGWVEESGIRWAVDASQRTAAGQPGRDENTWHFGLARLALGFSTGAEPARLFAGCAPLALDPGEAALLGHFLEFCSRLFTWRSQFELPADAAEWERRIGALVDDMLGPNKNPAEQKQLRRALRELSSQAERAGFDEVFDLASLRALLGRDLAGTSAAHGFVSGGVTFCRVMPMRSIPFKVLCLLGLDDGKFPGRDERAGFDLIARQRKPGDRSRRDDDRQLFLEALLCARERLIISYVGHSPKDGKPLPPSVLVSELIDQAAQSCRLPDSPQPSAAELSERLTVHQPLSAASPRNFGHAADRRLFSYSQADCRAAAALIAPVHRAACFAVVSAPAPAAQTLALGELERCLMRPSREFCQRRLGLYLGSDLGQLSEREPFALDPLERWQIGNEWLERLREDPAAVSDMEVQRALGRLPFGAAGKRVYDALARDVAAISGALAQVADGPRRASLPIDLPIAGLRLTGSLDELWSANQVGVQYSKLSSRHELRQFIRHVVLCCVAEQQPELALPTTSVLIGRKNNGVGAVRFSSGAAATSVLTELIVLYREALSAPLPLFAEASRAYVNALARGKSEADALDAARSDFGTRARATENPGGDQDAYVRQLYADFDEVLSARPGAFARSARRLYEPLLQSRSEP
jgi:exodeoxyribonuclease V gamma subunit